MIKKCGYEYNEKDDIYWNNEEFVLEAIKVDGWSLGCASEKLKNDKEFIFKALKNHSKVYSSF